MLSRSSTRTPGRSSSTWTPAPTTPKLSPDGRFAVVSQAGQDQLYDLETGATCRVPLSSYGRSSNGTHVFGVQGSTLTTCSTLTGDCHDTSVPPVGRNTLVRYAGRAFES